MSATISGIAATIHHVLLAAIDSGGYLYHQALSSYSDSPAVVCMSVGYPAPIPMISSAFMGKALCHNPASLPPDQGCREAEPPARNLRRYRTGLRGGLPVAFQSPSQKQHNMVAEFQIISTRMAVDRLQ